MMDRIALPAPACPVIMGLHVVKVGIHTSHNVHFHHISVNCPHTCLFSTPFKLQRFVQLELMEHKYRCDFDMSYILTVLYRNCHCIETQVQYSDVLLHRHLGFVKWT